MKHAILALTALFALPSAALACSCMNTDDPVQLRELAKDAARGAVALVELEAVSDYDPMKEAGEKVRVIRTLSGTAPESLKLSRRRFASGASCDDVLQAGQRRVVILYPVAGSGSYRVSSLCTNLLLEKPAFRDAVTAGIGSAGERG